MKQFILVLLVLGCGCTSHRVDAPAATYYAGGDGSSLESAITFPHATSSADGVPLEYQWLAEHYPGYRRTRQASLTVEGRQYDMLKIITADGAHRTVYFDMTSWFGVPGLKK